MNFTEKYGYWTVADKKFFKKYDALLYATTIKQEVKFYYHDDVWNKFDRSLLGKISLPNLYKQRALQLRDTYEYLVLYYSGGADSHNILKTFIDNDIKLDEICVKWPKTLMDGNLYTPNSVDRSGKNYWSEWNYAIKPILEWLVLNRPNIKITIKDYTEDIDKLDISKIFEKLNFVRGGGMLMNSVISDSDLKYAGSNKKIAHIYGIDKPLLFNHKNKMYMFFTDVCLDQFYKSDLDPENTECFYWTPDFPLLPFEMAYQLTLYFKTNPDKINFTWNINSGNPTNNSVVGQFLTDLSRNLLYTNWDHRFQADKPNETRTDKFFWFYEHSELKNLREKYSYDLQSRISTLGDPYLTSPNKLRFYEICHSKFFYITDL